MKNTTLFIYLIQLLSYIDICLQNLSEDEDTKKLFAKLSKGMQECLNDSNFLTANGMFIKYDEHTILFQGVNSEMNITFEDIFYLVTYFGDKTGFALFLRFYTELSKVLPAQCSNFLEHCL